jgi:hypothetical protein
MLYEYAEEVYFIILLLSILWVYIQVAQSD